MFKTLRQKIVILSASIALLSAVLVGSANYAQVSDDLRGNAIDKLAGETRLIAVRFKGAYDEIINDAYVVSNTPPIQGIVRSTANGDIDPLDDSTTEIWRERLGTIFTSIMRYKPYYTQMRYLGVMDQGKEIVRVNRSGNNRFEYVVANALQKKEQEFYFQESLSLTAGEVYISKVTYNKEKGLFERQKTPTMRVVVPVFDAEVLFGFIIINVDYRRLMERQFNLIAPHRRVYIMNNWKDYAEFSPEGGFQGLVMRGVDAHPLLKTLYLDIDNEQSEKLVETQGYMAYAVKLPLVDNAKTNFIDVAVQVPVKDIYKGARLVLINSIIISLMIAAVIMLLAVLISYKLTRPLKKMTMQIFNASEDPDKVHDLPVDRSDEVGELARVFEALATDLMKSELRARTIIENASDGIICIDEHAQITSFNKSSEEIFGYTSDEVIGQNVNILMPEPYHSQHNQYIHAYHKTNIRKAIGERREVLGKRKNGEVFPMELSVSEERMDHYRSYTGIARDISKIKQAEGEREKMIEALEHYSRILTHDIQAPISQMSWLTDKAIKDLDQKEDDELRKSLGMMSKTALSASNLIAAIRQFNNAEWGEVELASVQMQDVINEVMNNLERTIFETHTTINVNSRMPPKIDGDYASLVLLMQNLLSNAMKYCRERDPVINVSAVIENGCWVFSIEDNGIGMPKDQLENIFGMFTRLHGKGGEFDGSGIGLATCQKIVEKHGGRIWCDSEENIGTTFKFSLPITRERQ